MVTASLLPLVVLVVTRLLGANLRAAVIAALVCSTVLLCVGRLAYRPARPADHP